MLTLPDWKIVVHNILQGIIKITVPEGAIRQQSTDSHDLMGTQI